MPTSPQGRGGRLLVQHQIVERQFSRVLDLLHGESRGHITYLDLGDQFLVEGVVGRDVGNDDPQQVVHVAAHAVEFDDLGKILHHLGKTPEPFMRVRAGADGDEGGDAGVDLDRVEQRDPAADDALLLELLYAAPAGRRRQSHLLGDVGDGESRVFLQKAQDLTVETVHGKAPEKKFSPN
jgi:hypothetical protein